MINDIIFHSRSIEILEGRCLKGSRRSESSMEVTIATKTRATSRHLSTQHCEETVCERYTYWVGGREGGKTKQASEYTLHAKHMALSLEHLPLPHTYQRDCWPPLA